jgi:glutathione S-transferase
MSITLCGFALSSYVNKVKLVLLEKGLPFTEEHVGPGAKGDDVLSASPLGKVPFICTEHGTPCERSAIVECLEALVPTPALLPADPWAAAKVRELMLFIDLHLESVTPELHPQASFGARGQRFAKGPRAQAAG